MKNNSKYTKNKDKWLDIYKICKLKLHQLIRAIISLIGKNQNSKSNLLQRLLKNLRTKKTFGFKNYQRITILDKYILKSFIFSFFSVISVLVWVIVGRLLIKLLEYVVEGRFEVEMVFSILFLSTSKSVILLLPFALMISLIISLSRFYRDSAIFALKSSGNYKSIFTTVFYFIAIPSFLLIFLLNIFLSLYLIA